MSEIRIVQNSTKKSKPAYIKKLNRDVKTNMRTCVMLCVGTSCSERAERDNTAEGFCKLRMLTSLRFSPNSDERVFPHRAN